MEFVAAVVIGLNPYVGLLLLAALAARTTYLPLGPLVPPSSAALHAVMVVAAFAVAADLVVGKLPRFAPRCRRVSQIVAPAAAALAAAALTQSEWPPLTIAGAAALAYVVAALLSGAAVRGRRAPAWCGWGHIPVLMAAATGSATIVPLTIARLPFLPAGGDHRRVPLAADCWPRDRAPRGRSSRCSASRTHQPAIHMRTPSSTREAEPPRSASGS